MFFVTGLWVWPLWGRNSLVHSLGVCIYELVHHHIFTLLYLPSAGALPAKPDRHTHTEEQYFCFTTPSPISSPLIHLDILHNMLFFCPTVLFTFL